MLEHKKMDQQKQIQEDIIHELGLENLPKDKQQELIGKMTETLFARIYTETLEKLSDADKEVYGKMIGEKASPEEFDKFLTEKIPDYEQMIQKTIADFKEEMKKA